MCIHLINFIIIYLFYNKKLNWIFDKKYNGSEGDFNSRYPYARP